MKFIILISSLVAVAWSAPSLLTPELKLHAITHIPELAQAAIRQLPALRHEEVHDEFGQYVFRYVTAENTVVSERGRLVRNKDGGYVMVIEGQYEFVGTDGMLYATKYRGDSDGFHVETEQVPIPVPVPAI